MTMRGLCTKWLFNNKSNRIELEYSNVTNRFPLTDPIPEPSYSIRVTYHFRYSRPQKTIETKTNSLRANEILEITGLAGNV